MIRTLTLDGGATRGVRPWISGSQELRTLVGLCSRLNVLSVEDVGAAEAPHLAFLFRLPLQPSFNVLSIRDANFGGCPMPATLDADVRFSNVTLLQLAHVQIVRPEDAAEPHDEAAEVHKIAVQLADAFPALETFWLEISEGDDARLGGALVRLIGPRLLSLSIELDHRITELPPARLPEVFAILASALDLSENTGLTWLTIRGIPVAHGYGGAAWVTPLMHTLAAPALKELHLGLYMPSRRPGSQVLEVLDLDELNWGALDWVLSDEGMYPVPPILRVDSAGEWHKAWRGRWLANELRKRLPIITASVNEIESSSDDDTDTEPDPDLDTD